MKINYYKEDLKFSKKITIRKMMNHHYRKSKYFSSTYGSILKITPIQGKTLQIKGVDLIIDFENGRRIYIDEKVRRKWVKYKDILLEEYHDYDKKIPGWLKEGQLTDYVIYVKLSTRKVYILPFKILLLVWKENYENWWRQYGRVLAKNKWYTPKRYRTSCIPIPPDILLNKINDKKIELRIKNEI